MSVETLFKQVKEDFASAPPSEQGQTEPVTVSLSGQTLKAVDDIKRLQKSGDTDDVVVSALATHLLVLKGLSEGNDLFMRDPKGRMFKITLEE